MKFYTQNVWYHSVDIKQIKGEFRQLDEVTGASPTLVNLPKSKLLSVRQNLVVLVSSHKAQASLVNRV